MQNDALTDMTSCRLIDADVTEKPAASIFGVY